MAQGILFKTCMTCKETKTSAGFYKCRRWTDGLDYSCKICRTEFGRRTRQRILQTEEGRLREKELSREKARKRTLVMSAEERSRNRARSRKHYWENRELYFAYSSARKARKQGSGGSHTPAEWRQLKELFGGKCIGCGEAKKLTQDHVQPISRGGTDYIVNIQPLCLMCNKKKFTKTIDYRLKSKVVLNELNQVGKQVFSNVG